MRKQILLVFLLFALVSCQNETYVFSEYKTLGGTWKASDTLHFELAAKDTIALNNLYFHIRATQKYPYNNIFIIATLNFPNGKTLVDTLEYDMAFPDGKLMGSGGSIKESLLWYKQNVQFLEEGTYQISLRQANRKASETDADQDLEGIEEVGLAIEKKIPNE